MTHLSSGAVPKARCGLTIIRDFVDGDRPAQAFVRPDFKDIDGLCLVRDQPPPLNSALRVACLEIASGP
jgi:hypothetical protein